MMRVWMVVAVVVLLALLAGAAWAGPVQGASVGWSFIGGGGPDLEAGGVQVRNTLGQPVVGREQATGDDVCAGFWCRALAVYKAFLPAVVRNFGG